ncbi:CheR family methyltransferase [Paenibacillus beijingensis]|uniref:protein-glutamate O-methyltransferase n=1 Tax=Paenibacillus beijingensis TaxID=1126833 RepID=A0A0D5NQB5_9BACL|nr:protein-glutamate O-methyltransferase CheR [Paenibacillus beijingensis]AJY77167.1 chemotaxis protein CheR [Paenibacillus beijingensis]
MEDRDFAQFISRIKASTAIDLSQYKEAQMKRRLTTLRNKYAFATFGAYWQAMAANSSMMDEFLDRMTINVSEFWRNRARWEALEQRFLPEMLRGSAKLRFWSAACSTGEEPYTLAMIMHRLNALERCSIEATDLDAGVLVKAKADLYHERSVKDVPPFYLDRYFKKEADGYSIAETLRRSVRFGQQNLLQDDFGGPYDLIICRNVMIYFTEEAKHLLYRKFSQALKPGGILFVGSTEQIFSPGQYRFETVETFFYRKQD